MLRLFHVAAHKIYVARSMLRASVKATAADMGGRRRPWAGEPSDLVGGRGWAFSGAIKKSK